METLSRMFLTFLLNSLWQVPLVAALAWLISKTLSQAPASHRHTVWMAALAASLVLPVSSVRVSELRAQFSAPPETTAAEQSRTAVAPLTPSPSGKGALPAASTRMNISVTSVTARILLTAWVVFLAFRFGLLGLAFVRTAQIRRASVMAQPSGLLGKIRTRTAANLGVASAELRVSPSVAGPVTIGAWKSAIILPEALLHETSEEVLTTAIGHEMAHIARHDYALNILAELLCLPIFFQPATLLMRRALLRSRELACDELVTLRVIDCAAYARSILTLAHDAAGLPRPAGYSLGVSDGNFLDQRIRRLLGHPPANLKRARFLLATGLSALAICVAIASGLAISARAQSAAMPEMKLAENAFNSGNPLGAVEHFQNAVKLDPENVNARLFLAMALTHVLRSQPGGPAPAPNGEGQWAPVLRQYEEVLARDPANQMAIVGLATLAGPDLWQQTHARIAGLIAADPQNRAAYYATGVMDWQFAFKPIRQAFGGGQITGLIPDPALRRSLQDTYQSTIDEGVRMMQTVLQLSPGSPDALAYLNLLYREAACLADTEEQSNELTARADEFVTEALAAAKARAAAPPPTGQLNVDLPPSSAMMTIKAPPASAASARLSAGQPVNALSYFLLPGVMGRTMTRLASTRSASFSRSCLTD